MWTKLADFGTDRIPDKPRLRFVMLRRSLPSSKAAYHLRIRTVRQGQRFPGNLEHLFSQKRSFAYLGDYWTTRWPLKLGLKVVSTTQAPHQSMKMKTVTKEIHSLLLRPLRHSDRYESWDIDPADAERPTIRFPRRQWDQEDTRIAAITSDFANSEGRWE